MAKELNRIKTQIDFSATRGHMNSALIYTVLMHYNRGGSTDMTSSELIGEAFDFYDATEAVDITLFLDAQARARSFMDRYSVEDREDIRAAVEKNSVVMETDLLEPGKKFFCFDADNPAIQRMWFLLEKERYRDRASFINKFLFQYFAHGNCAFYNALCSERLLFWLKSELKLSKEIGEERFEKLSGMLWLYAQNSDPIIENDVVFSEEMSAEDRLRRAMGLI